MLVVTITEGEERGMCIATLRELLRVVRDQIEERDVTIIMSNKESIVWRKTSVKTLLREKQLKDTDVEEMRGDLTLSVQGNLLRSKVVMMDGSKVGKFGKLVRQPNWKSVVMDGPKVGEFGKVGKEQKFKSIVMDGVKIGKVGKLES